MDAARWMAAKRLLQAALELPVGERAALLEASCAGDAELKAEVAALLQAHDVAQDRFDRSPVGAGIAVEAAGVRAPPPERIDAYRVVRELGHGGMGTVYLAEREGADFHQQVAIKLIDSRLGGMASEAIVHRFHNERRILASLNHPNIARLYDGGTAASGQPYFVMEYVDGQPLDRWCSGAGSIEARLELFRKVCAAVHYAHQNLVVHRDLKPGNILVTADGTPKLLDFGIAKLLDAEGGPVEELTVFSRPMTPEYASPEQARGEAITTASDVYSLGVLLYQLLTGQLPYRIARGSSAAEVMRIVGEEEPPPPSTIARTQAAPSTIQAARGGRSPHLSADLDAITLQAMRKDPRRRYASADQLSEDLRRYLTGLPVLARRDSLGYRMRKFVGRHRAGVVAAALAAVALLASTGVAVEQARVARRHFAEVRRLANSFLFEFHDAIQDLPGATAARELVVRKALEYLDGLASEAGGDQDLLGELAEAYQRVGDVQGMPYRSSLGHTEDALRSYEKALALRGSMLQRQPSDPDLRLAKARVESRIGAVLAARGDTRAALARHNAALVEVSALAALPYPPAAAELATTAVSVGDDQWELGDLDSAIAGYRVALEAAQANRRDHPEDREARRYVGVVEQRLGDGLGQQKHWAEALEHQKSSLAVDQELAAANSASAETQRDLSTDYTRLAVAYRALGDRAASLVQDRQALAIRERLRAQDPKDSRALTDLAESLVQIAGGEMEGGDYATALTDLRRALPLRREQSAIDPTNLRWKDDLAAALTHYGTALASSGDRTAALTAFHEALSLRESIAATNPEWSATSAALANLYVSLGQVQTRTAEAPGSEACGWLMKAKDAFAQVRAHSGLTGDAVDWAAAADRAAARCGTNSSR
ncbi:MAG: protein kinase [Acidobacteriota bacterium]